MFLKEVNPLMDVDKGSAHSFNTTLNGTKSMWIYFNFDDKQYRYLELYVLLPVDRKNMEPTIDLNDCCEQIRQLSETDELEETLHGVKPDWYLHMHLSCL